MEYEAILESFASDHPEQALGALLASIPDPVLWLDAELIVRGLNRETVPGSRSRMVGRSILDFALPEERAVAATSYEQVRASRRPHTFQMRALDAKGKNSIFETRVAPLLLDGEVSGFVVHSTDVTRLKQGEFNLALAVRATGMGLWSFDVNSGIVDWNAEMHEITGLDEPLGPDRYVEELVHPDDRLIASQQRTRSLQSGAFESDPHRIVRPDGTVRWVMALGSFEFNAQGHPVFMHGATIDISEQKRQERAALAAQKLEAVGQLAAGMAHNFNNLLCVIAPALEEWAETASPGQLPLVLDSQLAARRAADLVKQLVSFARLSEDDQLKALHPLQIVEEALRVSRRLAGDVLDIQFEATKLDGVLWASEGQLEQAIINITVNARDAIASEGRGGKLFVRLDVGRGLPARLQDQGPFACLELRDDGPGMSEEVRQRVFDPFFTTKQPGRGTGLGLSTAYASIVRMGGAIECESTRGVGTTFSIYLPLTPEPTPAPTPLAAPNAEPERRLPPLGAGLRVLVVDDEDLVRRALLTMLSRAGATSTGVGGGQAALDLLRTDHFDIALLDRNMPGMDGISLARALRADHPALKLILVTGGQVDAADEHWFDLILGKPVRPDVLVEGVRRVRDRQTPA